MLDLSNCCSGSSDSTKNMENPANKRKRSYSRQSLGILGYPKRKRILFMVGRNAENCEESDESSDSDYTPKTSQSLDDSNFGGPRKRKLFCEKSKSLTIELMSASKSLRRSKQLRSTKSNDSLSQSIDHNESENWSRLIPFEILLRVFEYYLHSCKGDMNQLNKLKKVCLYWSMVSEHAQLWHTLNLSTLFAAHFAVPVSASSSPSKSPSKISRLNEMSNTFHTQLKRIVRVEHAKFKHIVSLNLSHLTYLTCDDLELVLSNCNESILKILDVSNCRRVSTSNQADKCFEKVIADNCSSLRHLNLASLDKQLSPTASSYLFSKLNSNLRTLNLSSNVLPVNYLSALVENCSQLEDLDISHSGLKGIVNLDQLSENCSQLKRLNMLCCYPKIKYNSIVSVIASPPAFLKLETLSLSFSQHSFIGSSSMLILIAKLCKDAECLKSLDLRYYKSPLDCFFNMFSMIKNDIIERLYLCNSILSDSDNNYLAYTIQDRWVSSLVVLDLSWSNITLDALDIILNSFVNSGKLCKLEVLDLSGTCVNSFLVKKVCEHVKTLKAFNLSSCRSVDRGMKRDLNSNDLKMICSSF